MLTDLPVQRRADDVGEVATLRPAGRIAGERQPVVLGADAGASCIVVALSVDVVSETEDGGARVWLRCALCPELPVAVRAVICPIEAGDVLAFELVSLGVALVVDEALGKVFEGHAVDT